MMTWMGCLAEVDAARVRELARAFERPSNYDSGQILGVAFVVLAGCGLLALAVNVVRRQLTPRPGDYLAQAARQLGLSRLQLHDLRRLAAQARLRQPASMLLSPANLAEALRRSATVPDRAMSTAAADRLAQRLFDVPLPLPPGTPRAAAPVPAPPADQPWPDD